MGGSSKRRSRRADKAKTCADEQELPICLTDSPPPSPTNGPHVLRCGGDAGDGGTKMHAVSITSSMSSAVSSPPPVAVRSVSSPPPPPAPRRPRSPEAPRLTRAYVRFFTESNAYLFLSLFRAAVIAAEAEPARAAFILSPSPSMADLPYAAAKLKASRARVGALGKLNLGALRQYAALLPTLEMLEEEATRGEEAREGDAGAPAVYIDDFIDYRTSLPNGPVPGLSRLFSWVVRSNASSYLVPLPAGQQLPELGTSHQYLMLVSDYATEAEFRRLRAERGSSYAFHGSRRGHWHSILRNGLINCSGTANALNGALFGPGVYISPNLATSLAYCAVLSAQLHTPLTAEVHMDPSTMACIALCEVINGCFAVPSIFCWTVPNAAHIRVRFVFVYPTGKSGAAAGDTTTAVASAAPTAVADTSFGQRVRSLHETFLRDHGLL